MSIDYYDLKVSYFSILFLSKNDDLPAQVGLRENTNVKSSPKEECKENSAKYQNNSYPLSTIISLAET